MARATVLSIVNSASGELGLPLVTESASVNNALAVQQIALLNALGKELITVMDWQFLLKTLNEVADGVNDTFPLPADYYRQVNQTQWSSSQALPMYGPTSPQVWSWAQFGIVAVGFQYYYRIVDNKYQLFPLPGAGQTFDMYYISNGWVESALNPGTFTYNINNSGDIPLFEERLLVTGLKSRLWAAKGFDNAALEAQFMQQLNAAKAQSAGAGVINLGGQGGHFYLDYQNVPQTGFGV